MPELMSLVKRICLRCGWEWWPRKLGRPTVCPNPNCKTPYWDKPKLGGGGKKG